MNGISQNSTTCILYCPISHARTHKVAVVHDLLCPPTPNARRDILDSVRIPGVSVGVTVWYPPYFLNQWVEFYQTCMDTSLGQAKPKSGVSFGDSDPIFKVTRGLRLLNFLRQRRRDRLLYSRYLLNQWMTVTKLAWIYHWDKLKS